MADFLLKEASLATSAAGASGGADFFDINLLNSGTFFFSAQDFHRKRSSGGYWEPLRNNRRGRFGEKPRLKKTLGREDGEGGYGKR